MVHVGVAVVVISARRLQVCGERQRRGDDGIEKEGRGWDYGSVTIED